MIYSPGRRYLFIHIPKTGGTSLSLALEQRAMRDDVLVGDTPKAKRRRPRLKHIRTTGRLWKHARVADLDGWLTPDILDQTFAFTLVRNPWDRLVSYYHWLQQQRFDHDAVRKAKAMPFAPFLTDPSIAASLRAAPYASYMLDAAGRERCDAYLRLEHLAEDLALVEAHLGFAVDMPHTNASQRDRDYRRYYQPDLAAHVADIAAPDIARFGYTFEDGAGP
ncbi:MAG: sulfotransferase family 2 domain-containing protein [Pseudomonadota bacterium]